MPNVEILFLYKTRAEQRVDAVLGYLLGLATAVGLRTYTSLPYFIGPLGFLVAYLLVTVVSSAILRRRGRMIPGQELKERRRQEFQKQNTILAVVERTLGMIIVVATVVVLVVPESPSQILAVNYAMPRAVWAFLSFWLLWVIYTAWRRERRARRILDAPERSPSRPFDAIRRWSPFFYIVAGLLFALGLASTTLTPNGWRPLAAGGFSAAIIVAAVRAGAAMPAARPAWPIATMRLIGSSLVAGVLWFGLPMGASFSILSAIFVVAFGAHAAWGMVGGKIALLMAFVPVMFAISLAGGLAFGIMIAMLVRILLFVSPQMAVRVNSSPRVED